jgi:hypothetical protein
MAVSISRYNHTAKLLLNKEIVYTTLKAMLLNATATFTASHTTLSSVTNAGAYQVSGNGWAAGGETLASVAVTVVDTNDAMIDADDISKTASGGSIGPAYGAVIYDDTHASDAPLWFINFDGAKEAGVGTDFKINWNASGIFRVAD